MTNDKVKIFLTYSTEEGSDEIEFDGEKISFGRGTDADLRFADEGLSRLNSTIYHEHGKIWILDENSTNGTFVNGEKVSASGIPLKNGDEIRIGNYTKIRIKIIEEKKATQPVENKKGKVVSSNSNSFHLLPILVTLFAVFVIGISASVIAYKMLSKPKEIEIVDNQEDFPTPKPNTDEIKNINENSPINSSPTSTKTPANAVNKKDSDSNISITNSPEAQNQTNQIQLPNKKYQEMSVDEKLKYVEVKSRKVAKMIGNDDQGAIPPEAVKRIKSFLDGYVSRINAKRRTTCGFGDNMQSTIERAGKNAPFIIRAFNEQGLDPQIGLYLAMVESEHCPCLVSPTQAKGLFQFLASTARDFEDLQPPDKRCEQEPSAKAAAKYMKQLTGRIGTGPLSVPLAIGSYNSGQGALSGNLKKALEANGSQERSFWTLVANSEKLSKQFQLENVKYVPKFFAAAIIGENPNDFGINLPPLSTKVN